MDHALTARAPLSLPPAPMTTTTTTTTTTSTSPRSPSKVRSLSDGGVPNILSPSPHIREAGPASQAHDSLSSSSTAAVSASASSAANTTTQDDIALPSPSTPRRRPTTTSALSGLSLQMPEPWLVPAPGLSGLPGPPGLSKGPLPPPPPPPLGLSQTYGSPSNVLPRRSRGLDFARAATNLHHSTLAESSPDSSPTIGVGGGAANRRGLGMASAHGHIDVMGHAAGLWTTTATTTTAAAAMPSGMHVERVHTAGSAGSNAHFGMGSDDSDSTSDEDLMDADDVDESILSTPQAHGMPYMQASPGAWNLSSLTSGPGMISGLMNYQRSKHRPLKGRPAQSHVGHGDGGFSLSKRSPTSLSQDMAGPARLFESSSSPPNPLELVSTPVRRESISWAANQLNISGPDTEENNLRSTLENMDSSPITPGRDGQRGVVRRVVTRRGNMLPKTKTFARIRAALAEESTPVEAETRREAEVVRQTWESDTGCDARPVLQSPPAIKPHRKDSTGGLAEDEMVLDSGVEREASFNQQATQNSKGMAFWNTFTGDKRRTTPPPLPPPPPPATLHGQQSVSNDDMILETPIGTTTVTNPFYHGPFTKAESQTSSNSRSSTPQQGMGPSTAEITRKVNNKRRREDDFDSSSFKRRAVSPGMSVHNSPIIQSPMQRDAAWASRPPSTGEGKMNPTAGASKRVGYQGMVDTNDGLMKMSIE